MNNLNVEDFCGKCKERVYQMERVGPVKELIFHRHCFKCIKCGKILNLKNYYFNPLDSSDKQLYCLKDCPKLASAGMDCQAIGIKSALLIPNPNLNSSNFDVIKWFGESPRVGADARHIREALLAQSEFQKKYFNSNKHHFPVWFKETKEKLLKYQEELEIEQRKEEDKMVEGFYNEEIKVEEGIKREMEMEFEKGIQKLKQEKFLTRQKSDAFQKDIEEFSKSLTLNKKKKLEKMKLNLKMEAQAKTSKLIENHSQQMLTLIKKKQQQIQKEITPSEEEKDFVDVLSVVGFPQEVPDAHPPNVRKRDLYYDSSVFEEIDKNVLKVAESEQSTFTELVSQLTEGCLSDLQKSRAIFRWITIKDLNMMEFSDSIKQDSPLGILRGIKFGTETYHTLFMRLCSYAGLECKEIKGHSKSVGYEPGMKIRKDSFLNNWNVVLIGGNWWPVQCNWGARHLILNKEKKDWIKKERDIISYKYDEHYFLTDPDEFIMEFWAEDPKWQLLEKPILLEDFESFPFVRSIFFHYGLEFDNQNNQAVLETNNSGGLEIKIKIPDELKQDLIFHYKLKFADREKRNLTHFKGVTLERYVLHLISDNVAFFSLHIPCPTDYFLEIYITKVEPFDMKTNIFSKLDEPVKLKCAAKFKINCSHMTSKMHPLPNCALGEWGPIKGVRLLGLQPLTHPFAVINAEEKLEIKIKLKVRMRVLAKLFLNGVERKSLEKFLKVELFEDNLVLISINFPQPGQYGLDFYASAEKNGNFEMSHVFKYLINCPKVSNPITLPSSNLSRQVSQISTNSFNNSLKIETDEDDCDYKIPDSTVSKKSESFYFSESMRGRPFPNSLKLESNQHFNSTPPPVLYSPSSPSLQAHSLSLSPKNLFSSSQPGPKLAMNNLGIKPSTHKDPLINKLDKNEKITIEFSKPNQETKIIPTLISTQGEDFSQKVTIKDSGKKVKFTISSPEMDKLKLIFKASNPKLQPTPVDIFIYEINFSNNKNKINKK